MKPAKLGRAPGHHLTLPKKDEHLQARLGSDTPPEYPPPGPIIDFQLLDEHPPIDRLRRRTLAEMDAALARHHRSMT